MDFFRILAFDARARSAREFMNLTSAERIREANPNLEIKPTIVNTANAPKVSFEFIDGNKQEIDSQGFVASEILQELHTQASQIEYKFELEGKEI